MTHPVKLIHFEWAVFRNTKDSRWVGGTSYIDSPAVFIELYGDAPRIKKMIVELYGDVPRIKKMIVEFYFDIDSAIKTFVESYGNSTELSMYFLENYGNSLIVNSLFSEKYEGFPEVKVRFEEKFSDMHSLLTSSIETYSDFLRIFTTFIEKYNENLVTQKYFQEKYDDSAIIQKYFQEKYDQLLSIFRRYEEKWNIFSTVKRSFSEVYGISAFSVVKSFEEPYHLQTMNRILKTFVSPYYILEGSTIHYTPSATLLIDGESINFNYVSVEMGLDKYCNIVEIHVPTLSEYTKCHPFNSAALTIDGTVYNLFVENREKISTPEGYTYQINCLSITAKLDTPYSDPIIKDYSSEILASTVLQEMAGLKDIEVDNQLIDWNLSPISFSIQEETPLEVIRRIVNAVGGIIQTKPDGTLLLINEYQISPQYWKTSTPEDVFSLETDVLQIAETSVVNPGYNAFIITDLGNDAKTITLEEIDVDATTKIIKGFQTPFDESNPFSLQTSGGPVVTIDKYDYPVIEKIPIDEEWEIVEFLEKTGKTKYPIYEDSEGIDIIEYDWIEDDLGTITYQEDGTLTVDSEKDESLLRIKYNTKYWKWTVTGVMNKHTQFYVPDE